MNIFKVLANGDGRINEANISSFLAYLLDPKGDHGLKYEFLQRVLKRTLDDDAFKYQKYEYEIFLEQAFTNENSSKHIVDIVVICYKINKGTKNESLVKEFINNKKEIEKIFLIENKIQSGSVSIGQLVNQYESTKRELEIDLQNKIHSIYITPKDEKSIKEFKDSNLEQASHIFWRSLIDTEESIGEFITSILKNESKGMIEPLSEQVVYTLKAFNQFIKNNFKSQKIEEKERKFDYSYTNECIRLNGESQIESRLYELRKKLLVLDSSLIISQPIMNKVCEPELFLTHKNIGLSLYAGHKSRDSIILVYRVANSRNLLDKIAKNLGESIKKANYGNSAYFKQDWMRKKIPISDTNLIYDLIKKAILNIEKGMPTDNIG